MEHPDEVDCRFKRWALSRDTAMFGGAGIHVNIAQKDSRVLVDPHHRKCPRNHLGKLDLTDKMDTDSKLLAECEAGHGRPQEVSPVRLRCRSRALARL